MNFKKTLSLVLAVLMVIAVVPFSGMATDSECTHNYKYTNVDTGTHSYFCTLCKTGDYAPCSPSEEEVCGQQRACKYCHEPFGDVVAHVFDQQEIDDDFEKTPGDCNTKAVYYKSCKCGALPENLETAETFEGENGDHIWGDPVSNNDATCTENATGIKTCSECGLTEDVTIENSALQHNFSEEIVDPKYLWIAPTCTTKARYYKACSRCKESSEILGEEALKPSFETDVIPHNFVVPEAPIEGTGKDTATCTKPATFYMVCSECDISAKGIDETKFYEDPDGLLKEHNYVNNAQDKYIISQATCSFQAIYSKSCNDCGIAAVVDNNGNVLGSPGFDSTSDQINVFVEGEYVPENSKANAFRWGEALNHGKTEISKEAKEPDCTNKGNTEEVKCSYCKVVLTESQDIPALGHDLAAKPLQEYKAPTCVQYGQLGKVNCERCKKTFAFNGKNEILSIDNIKDFKIEPYGHLDDDSNLVCDRPECGSLLEPSDTCTCICHSTGFMFFIAFIIKWFWQLTGSQPMCSCGEAHY